MYSFIKLLGSENTECWISLVFWSPVKSHCDVNLPQESWLGHRTLPKVRVPPRLETTGENLTTFITPHNGLSDAIINTS
jgi:hypothetical protein